MFSVKKYVPFIFGFILFYNGILFSYLFVDGHSPFYQTRPENLVNQSINPNTTHDFGFQIGITSSTYPTRVKILFFMEGSSEVEVFIYYHSDNDNVLLFSQEIIEIARVEVTTEITGRLLSNDYFIHVSVRNLGSSSVFVNSIQASELSILLGFYIWIMMTLLGFCLMALNIYFLKKRKKRKFIARSPEPVLFHKYQEQEFGKQMLSSKGKKKEPKQERKPVQPNKCPNCEGIVPKNSQHCPHCYKILS